MSERLRPEHEDAEDAAIARALGADGGGPDAADLDPRGRDLLDEYRLVVSQFPFDEVAPPAALEERVIAVALERRPAAGLALEQARRRRTARRFTLAVAAAAAAVVVGLMVTGGGDGSTVRGRVEAVAATVPDEPGTRRAPLVGSDVSGTAALADDGSGALYDLELPARRRNFVLSLWLVAGRETVLVGPVPATGDPIAFEVFGDVDAVDGVALSYEQQGVTPKSPTREIARADFSRG